MTDDLTAIMAEIESIKADMKSILLRLASLENTLTGIKRENVLLYETTASQHVSHDRLTERMDRIERRIAMITD